MRRFLKFLVFSVLIALPALGSQIYAEEEGDSEEAAHPRYLMAIAEAEGTNVFFHLFDRFVLRTDYAQTTWSTMRTNLSSAWVFDHDSFTVNEIAHPYHGSLYFNSGRSNGLNFWESTACAAAGSATWELFGENELPSINDIVSTTMGGAVLGEMFHRIYFDAKRADSPLRLVASPMDALTDGLFGDELAGSEMPQIPSELALSLRAGMSFPSLDMAEARGVDSGAVDPLGQLSESLVYGSPFGDGPSSPFSHFEQRLRLGYSIQNYEIAFFSNGSLFSLPLVDGTRSKLSVGADLHYDFIFSSLVDISANAAGLSIAYASRQRNGLAISMETYLNLIAMGANDDVFLMAQAREAGEEADFRDYDFGFGEGAKVYFKASQPKLGSFGLDYAAYGLHAIPSSLEVNSDFSYALMGILELSYEHAVATHLALGIAYQNYHKIAFYNPGPTVSETMQSITLFVKFL